MYWIKMDCHRRKKRSMIKGITENDCKDDSRGMQEG